MHYFKRVDIVLGFRFITGCTAVVDAVIAIFRSNKVG